MLFVSWVVLSVAEWQTIVAYNLPLRWAGPFPTP